MAYATLEVERRGPVGWLVFDRPDQGNAMDAVMMAELEAALASASASRTASADLLLALLGREPGSEVELTDSLTLVDSTPADSLERTDLRALQAGLSARDAPPRAP